MTCTKGRFNQPLSYPSETKQQSGLATQHIYNKHVLLVTAQTARLTLTT